MYNGVKMKYTVMPLAALLTVLLSGCGGAQPVNNSSGGSPTGSSSGSSGQNSSSGGNLPDNGSPSGGNGGGDSTIIQEQSKGYCGTFGEVSTKHSGYTGVGFVDSDNSTAATIDWEIKASRSSTYSVTIRYANGGTAGRGGFLTANDNAGSAAFFSLNATDGWASWREETREISLNQGTNRLVMSTSSDEGLANIDWIKISGDPVTVRSCKGASSSSSSGSPPNPGSSSGAAPGSSSGSAPGSSSGGTGTSTPKMRSTAWVGYGSEVTGGAGGDTVTVSTGAQLHKALCDRPSSTSPLIIKVNGTINHGNTDTAKGSCNGTKKDAIILKQVANVTILGVGTKGVFDQVGIQINKATNIIVRNVHIKNVKKSGSPQSNGGDAIAIQGGPQTKIWIDHNTLEASGGESKGYDSLLDMKNDTTNVTVSYNHWLNSSRGGLIGSNDSPDGNNNIVFHHNFYENISQRTPLLRRATIHTFNNYWENSNGSDQIHYINTRAEGKALVENNYFKNVNNPVVASTDSDVPGCWAASGNAWEGGTYTRTPENGKAHKAPVNWSEGDLNGDNCKVNSSKPAAMDDAGDVPAIVKANAGVGKI